MGFVAAGCGSIGTLSRDCMRNSLAGLSHIRTAVDGISYKQLMSFSSDFMQPKSHKIAYFITTTKSIILHTYPPGCKLKKNNIL